LTKSLFESEIRREIDDGLLPRILFLYRMR
jgi:hypothetical protein